MNEKKFRISGAVISQSSIPVTTGMVAAERLNSNGIVAQTVLDTTGKFILPQLAAGHYTLKIASIGYKIWTNNNIVLTDKDIDLQNLILLDSTTTLKAINIAGSTPPIRSENGKLIIDATNKIYQTSGNALNLIARLPAVSVVQDNIRINGTVQPVVLINGKRSPLSIQELKNLPANEIKKIELITAPGSEYDGNYNAVIDITLNKAKYVNGSNVNGYLGYGRNQFNQLYGGLGYVHQKDGGHYFQADYDYSKYSGLLDFESNRQTETSQFKNTYSEHSFSKQIPNSHSLRLNYEKPLNDKSKLGLSVRGIYGDYKENTLTNSTLVFIKPQAYGQEINSNNDISSINRSIASTLFYQLKIDSTSDLSMQVNHGYFDQDQHQQIDITNSAITGLNSTLNDVVSQTRLLTFNADLKKRWKDFRFKTGIKASTTTADNNLVYDTLAGSFYRRDSARTNNFAYDEQIFAGYVNASRAIKGFNLTAGVRYEYTRGSGDLVTTKQKFVREYGNLLPYFNISRDFFNRSLNIDLSYTRKLQRPAYSDLNPFSIISSPYTRIEGNPYLQPAIFNSYEANFNYKNINLNISYRKRDDVISQMPFYDFQSQILTLKMVNINNRKSLVFALSYIKEITKWYTLQVSGTLLNDEFNSQFNGKNYHLQGYNFTFTTLNTFTILPGFLFTANSYYTTSSVYDIYRFKPQSSITTGIRKEFLNKKIILVAEYRDMFLGMKDKMVQNTDGFQNEINQFRGSRTFDIRLEFDLQKLRQSIKSLNIRSSEEESRVKSR
ncbi:outer membrane beta-barrel protein [Chitinophaga flava]|nr:outer membrane beta-barrel protein [Chitinophaga flava]